MVRKMTVEEKKSAFAYNANNREWELEVAGYIGHKRASCHSDDYSDDYDEVQERYLQAARIGEPY